MDFSFATVGENMGSHAAFLAVGVAVALIVVSAIRKNKERDRERLHISASEGADGICRWEGRWPDGEYAIGGRPRGRADEIGAYAAARRVCDAEWVFPEGTEELIAQIPRG